MRRLSAIAAILAVLVVPMTVHADSQVDPHASSPAGAVYEIPLQTARSDAAPHRKTAAKNDLQQTQSQGGGAGGGGTSGGSSGGGGVLPQGSAIKSENGYGSSSRVPGLSATRPGAAAQARSSAATPAATIPVTVSAKPAASSDSVPSASASYSLVILIVLGGAAVGVGAATAIRRTLGQPR